MAIGENLQVKVALEGPFFRGDPKKTFYANLRDLNDKIAAELEQDVRADILANEPAMPYWTGFTRDHVLGYTTSSVTGKRWAVYGAVGLPTAGFDATQARRTKAAGASIEGRFHPFARARRAVYHSRALLTADLTKGLT